VQVIKEGGQGAEEAASWLVGLYYHDVLRAAGRYLRHLDPAFIEKEMEKCAIRTAHNYDPNQGPFVAYYITTVKNRLFDICFRAPRNGEKVKDYEVFKRMEKQIKNIYDHKKILLLKKRPGVVRFYKSDLDVLTDEEKNMLALVSQIWCTNNVIAKAMDISKSKVGMLWERINRKLLPAFRKNRSKQFWEWAGTWGLDEHAAVKTSAAAVNEYIKESFFNEGENMSGGWSIEQAYFAGLDDDDDYNELPSDKKTKKRMVLCEREKERSGF